MSLNDCMLYLAILKRELLASFHDCNVKQHILYDCLNAA